MNKRIHKKKYKQLLFGNMKKLYICDPEKNTCCSKSGCWINGGECKFTNKERFRKTGRKIFTLKKEYRDFARWCLRNAR